MVMQQAKVVKVVFYKKAPVKTGAKIMELL